MYFAIEYDCNSDAQKNDVLRHAQINHHLGSANSESAGISSWINDAIPWSVEAHEDEENLKHILAELLYDAGHKWGLIENVIDGDKESSIKMLEQFMDAIKKHNMEIMITIK